MASLQEVFEAKAELQFGIPAGTLAACRTKEPDPEGVVSYECEGEKDSAMLSAMWLAFRWGHNMTRVAAEQGVLLGGGA